MKSRMVFLVLALGLNLAHLTAQTGPHLPSAIDECTILTSTKTCTHWTGVGGIYRPPPDAKLPLGVSGYSVLQVVEWTADGVVLNRIGSFPQQKGVYKGKVQGDHVVDGTVTWTDRDRTAEGKWTASLIFTSPEDDPIRKAIEAQTPSFLKTPHSPDTSPVRVGGGNLSQNIKVIDPIYPAEARAAHVEGVVIVYFIVGLDGKVESATASDGPAILRGPAIAAVKQYEFRPYLVNGEPRRVQAQAPVTFHLNAPYKADSSAEPSSSVAIPETELVVPSSISDISASKGIGTSPRLPSQHPALPASIHECDYVLGIRNCATWTSDGAGGYNGKWEHGETGHIVVSQFSGTTVEFQRQDSTTKKLQSTYSGQVVGDHFQNGVINWFLRGFPFHAKWTGELLYGSSLSGLASSESDPTNSPLSNNPPVSKNFLIGTWIRPELAKERAYMKASGQSLDFVFTETEVRFPSTVQTVPTPVQYIVNSPTSVTLQVSGPPKMPRTSILCSLLSSGDTYCTGFDMSGYVKIKD